MNTKIVKNFEIDQPLDVVWKNLSNPEEIVTCVPGASITEKIDDNNYKGAVVTKFGPIKAAYAGDIGIVEMDNDNYKMQLKGRGLDSKGKGSADMIMNGSLTEEGGKTQVAFSMDITIVGKLAQFGSRLINDVSDQLLNQFVTNFKKKLASEAPAPSTDIVDDASSSAAATIGEAVEEVAEAGKAVVDKVTNTATQASTTTQESAPADNSLDATSLIGTVIKSIFGGIIDGIKGIFGGGKK